LGLQARQACQAAVDDKRRAVRRVDKKLVHLAMQYDDVRQQLEGR
jgi:hypothetical protein